MKILNILQSSTGACHVVGECRVPTSSLLSSISVPAKSNERPGGANCKSQDLYLLGVGGGDNFIKVSNEIFKVIRSQISRNERAILRTYD